MCGRFSLASGNDILFNRFLLDPESEAEIRPRYNIAPGQDAPVVVVRDGARRLEMMHWGLIPFWAKDESIGNRLINARSETITEKQSFKNPFKRRRCLVPADGFYEWRKEPGGGKTPMRITLKSREPFAFAGLWEAWKHPQRGVIHSFTITTIGPNDLMAAIHDRMPVILLPEHENDWLNPDIHDEDLLRSFLKPYPAAGMESFEVSTLVNSPANDSPDCIAPAAEKPKQLVRGA